jgi:primary-amine oxidase
MPHLLDMPMRGDLKPYHVAQPEGPSFTVDGWEVRWQKWRMRIGFNVKEGLVLHTVGYEDGGRLRPIAHRLSFAELVVPYGDPSPGQFRRTAFDIGEWGFGELTNSLELGCDCLGEIRYFDVALADSKGEAYTIRNAVCLHEEDAGLLWKHVDPVAGTETRRMRRLVVSFVVTVANYEYLVYWRFYQDGSIECEVRLTGIPIVGFFPGREAPPYGALVDERTYAPYHQHLIVARLDLDVDGEQNTVYEVHTEAVPVGPDNPYGTAMIAPATPLRTESEAQQNADPASQRYWKVVNHGSLNGLGQPVAYKLLPTASPPAFVAPDSPAMRRAAVIGKHLWVTPFDRDERFPCGDYPNQSAADAGLSVWTEADRSVEDTDVVLWHVFGAHHVTRPEDWPMMPVEIVGFWLKPVGFFDRSPALDVPHSH